MTANGSADPASSGSQLPQRDDPDRGRDLVLYDGECGLCNGAVMFILRRDDHRRFLFAPLQSDEAQALLRRLGAPDPDLSTIYLVEDHIGDEPRLSRRSRAVLRICRHLGAPWSWLASLRVLPPLVLDPLYRLVAWSRYRLFGRLETCAASKPEWRDRFLWEPR